MSDIHNTVYTPNVIEYLNSVILVTIKKRKLYQPDDSMRKVIYLSITNASKKMITPINNWR